MLQRIRTFFLRRRSLREPSTNRNKRPKTNYLNGYRDQRTTIFLEIDNDSYLLEHLTYYSETKEFTVLTERVGDWEKVNFTCPEESELYSFFQNPLLQPTTRKYEEYKQNFRIKKFMTYGLNLKCIWQHPTTGNHLEITKIVWGEVENPIIITIRGLRLAQPGTWKIPIKQDIEGLNNLLLSLLEFTKFPFFAKIHPLQKQLVEELILYCQSLTLSTGQSCSKRPETSY